MDISFGEILLSTVWFMLVFAWIWLMVSILTDLFRDPSMSGWGKAAWTLFLIVLPWIGALTYLVARGRSMNERAAERARQQEARMRQYVREVASEPATTASASTSDDLVKLADLRQRGVLTQSEFERAKAVLLGSNGNVPQRA
ncbi:PLDc N-terminal domain-containing protein [Dactylosporangium sp. AC04546]|uniref:PLDc N-terminal domain-containing protein n=1 Tax=Dactylosporangium sp. AC04546 TaxID=2862460 RepID=UPI001EDDFD0D|nr:PLDc N-terminal domain-containing protein [Dactylosporangium sp. AC04546]WVK81261.1 PLDc N-terminal domain-containing protein [Dactylosporangium sp. AC04546]